MNSKVIVLARKLNKFNNDFINGRCRIVDKKVYSSKFLFYFYFYWSKEFYNNPYRKLLLDYFSKVEKIYPGSSYFVSVKLCNKILGINHKIKKELADRKYNNILSFLEKQTNKETFSLFKNIIEFSGADASISVEKNNNTSISVEKNIFPEFNIEMLEEFKSIYFKNVNSSTKDFLFCVVDGFIERESEIIPLLDKAKNLSIPLLVITRGFSAQSIKSLKSIILKNNLYVYPYVEKYNNEDPFKLKDLCQINNLKIVSSESGDNIYTDAVEKSDILRCQVYKNKIIFNSLTKNNLISNINDQIENNVGNKNLLDYLSFRKKRCTPNKVVVKIPKEKETYFIELRGLIKSYNKCVVGGVHTERGVAVICEEISNLYTEKLYNTLKNIKFKIETKEKKNAS